MKKQLSILITLIAVTLGVTPAIAGSSKIARDLRADLDRGTSNVRVIITLADGETETTIPGMRRGRDLAVRLGHLSGRQIQELAADPRVLSISPDRPIRATFDSVAGMDVAVATAGAAVADGFGLTGDGYAVALIDSGLTASVDVPSDRILINVDFTDAPTGGRDLLGHGTHIAGIIGGSGIDGAVRGVASEVNFVNLRVLDENGAGYASSVIEAIAPTSTPSSR